MVELEDERRSPSLQTLDDRELPLRPSRVEGGDGERGREVEHGPHIGGVRRSDATEVVVEVERGIWLPAQAPPADASSDDALTEARDASDGPLEGAAHGVGRRLTVEQADGEDR